MKKIFFSKLVILTFVMMLFSASSCERPVDGHLDLKAESTTEVGKLLIDNTEDLVASILEETTYSPANGVDVTELRYFSMKGYSMWLYVTQVDLTQPGVSLEVTTPNDGTKWGFQQMTVQASYKAAAGSNPVVAYNGDFYNTSTGVPNGIVFKNGTRLKNYTGSTMHYFALLKNGTCVCGDETSYPQYSSQIKEGLGGGVQLVENGKAVKSTDTSINPRTCIGVDQSGKKVTIMAVDGRNYHHSNGMTYEELSKCMLAFGAHSAINLDGGGSTTFAVQDAQSPGSFVVRNSPSDNGGKERAVANGIVVVAK